MASTSTDAAYCPRGSPFGSQAGFYRVEAGEARDHGDQHEADLARLPGGTRTPSPWLARRPLARNRTARCRRSSVDATPGISDGSGMPDLSRAFGEVVRVRRANLGISQEQLASLSGLHRTYLSRIELGRVRLGLDAAQRVANGLGVPLSELIAEAEKLADLRCVQCRT
jgi:ribosome-binding protein aMBF1 (putative translation factor)